MYLAKRKGSGEMFAVKRTIERDNEWCLWDEAKIMCRLRHGNVVRCFGFEETRRDGLSM